MRVLAIDPGNTESAYCLVDEHCKPLLFGKVANERLAFICRSADYEHEVDYVSIEMIASYGMSVGADVFETCVWIGRFYQILADQGADPQLVKRLAVKMHLCHTAAAKDANITQALKDRFAYGQPNHGKGTKNSPGWFYGFAADVWQAYALAVYTVDNPTLPLNPKETA